MMIGQLTLGMSALLLAAFAPPAQGRMLLVPVDGEPIPEAAVKTYGVTTLKPGPIDGSWIIEGRRDDLTGLFTSEGIIVLAAPAAICGGPVSRKDMQA